MEAILLILCLSAAPPAPITGAAPSVVTPQEQAAPAHRDPRSKVRHAIRTASVATVGGFAAGVAATLIGMAPIWLGVGGWLAWRLATRPGDADRKGAVQQAVLFAGIATVVSMPLRMLLAAGMQAGGYLAAGWWFARHSRAQVATLICGAALVAMGTAALMGLSQLSALAWMQGWPLGPLLGWVAFTPFVVGLLAVAVGVFVVRPLVVLFMPLALPDDSST